MEVKNPISGDGLVAPAPSSVRSSSLPNPESTRTPAKKKESFRSGVEETTSEVEKPKEEEIKEPIFSRDDAPEIKGTIVVTIFKNHPYEIEFSGAITGVERDLAIKFIMQKYGVWKNRLAREHKEKVDISKKED